MNEATHVEYNHDIVIRDSHPVEQFHRCIYRPVRPSKRSSPDGMGSLLRWTRFRGLYRLPAEIDKF